MHADFVNQRESPAFDTVQAAYLMVEEDMDMPQVLTGPCNEFRHP